MNLALGVLSAKHKAAAAAIVTEKICPIVEQNTKYGAISFFCPGSLPAWRAQTLLTKEEETIEWLDTFDESAVFWDIGANAGQTH